MKASLLTLSLVIVFMSTGSALAAPAVGTAKARGDYRPFAYPLQRDDEAITRRYSDPIPNRYRSGRSTLSNRCTFYYQRSTTPSTAGAVTVAPSATGSRDELEQASLAEQRPANAMLRSNGKEKGSPRSGTDASTGVRHWQQRR